MTSIYNNTAYNALKGYWDFVFTDLADPRTNSWPLIGSPIPGLTIMIMYWYFVSSWGPRYMANRKPYKLTNVLLAYNFFQICASGFIFYQCMDGLRRYDYSWTCESMDWSPSPKGLEAAWGAYKYFLIKLTELLDTVFFVLRKKDKQVTFLHVYHHSGMAMLSWGVTKYYPGGNAVFYGMINTFVHVVMYTYYLLAGLGPRFQPYLWWKKYITKLQLAQFVVAFLHASQMLIYDCDFPKWSLFILLPNLIFIYYLFSDFYKKAYSEENKRLQEKKLQRETELKKKKAVWEPFPLLKQRIVQ